MMVLIVALVQGHGVRWKMVAWQSVDSLVQVELYCVLDRVLVCVQELESVLV